MRKPIIALILIALFILPSTASAVSVGYYSDTVTNAQGTVLVGAEISVVAAGTNTLSTIYSDDAGTVAKDNPTSTNSSGFYSFYAAPGTYDVIIRAAGYGTKRIKNIVVTAVTISNTLYIADFDSLTAAVASAGTSARRLVIDAATTLTANTTIPSTLEIEVTRTGSIAKASTYTLAINGPFSAGLYQVFSGFSAGDVTGLKDPKPQWWGAVGDGTTDDSVALNCFLKAADTLSLPRATYAATNVTIPNNDNLITLYGNGATIKKISGGDDTYLIASEKWINNTASAQSPIKIYDLRLDGNNITTFATYVHQAWGSILEHVEITQSAGVGLMITAHTKDTTAISGTLVMNRVNNSRFWQNATGGVRVYDTNRNKATDNIFTDNFSSGSNEWGFKIDAGAGTIFKGNHMYANTLGSVYFDAVGEGTTFQGNYCEDNPSLKVNAWVKPFLEIQGNTFWGEVSSTGTGGGSNIEEGFVSIGNTFKWSGTLKHANYTKSVISSIGDTFYDIAEPLQWTDPARGYFSELNSRVTSSVSANIKKLKGSYQTRIFEGSKASIASATTTTFATVGGLYPYQTIMGKVKFITTVSAGYSGMSEEWDFAVRTHANGTTVSAPVALYQHDAGSENSGFLDVGAATVTAAIIDGELSLAVNATLSGSGYTNQTYTIGYVIEMENSGFMDQLTFSAQ